jgi:hypothetical protein
MRDWRKERHARSWPDEGRAATGIGSSVRSEVHAVRMELEPHPLAVVTVRYDYRRSPRPIVVPGFAPEPPQVRWESRREARSYSPEP